MAIRSITKKEADQILAWAGAQGMPLGEAGSTSADWAGICLAPFGAKLQVRITGNTAGKRFRLVGYAHDGSDVRPAATAPVPAKAPTLNEELARLGMTKRPVGHGRYEILRTDGSVFCEGRAGDVWEALHAAALA